MDKDINLDQSWSSNGDLVPCIYDTIILASLVWHSYTALQVLYHLPLHYRVTYGRHMYVHIRRQTVLLAGVVLG